MMLEKSNNMYWDRLKGYVTELRIDCRWILRGENNKPFGSLRIVSHPDLPPGYLRAIFTFVTKKTPKTIDDKIKTIEDYHIDIEELEVFSLDENINAETKTYEASLRELEELFDVEIL